VPRCRGAAAARGRRGAGRAGPGGSESAAAAPGRRGDLPDRRHRPAARPARGGGRVRPAEGRRRPADRHAGGCSGPVLGGAPAAPGAGAAGGTGYGLATAWGAALAPGAAELGRLAGLDRALAVADLVITGEGRFDATSLTGKTTGTVMAAAAAAGVPVALVAGQVSGGLAGEEPAPDGVPAPVAVIALNELADGTAPALASPRRWLR